MTRHAQAALEYLFTYGWAFLAILVTIGVLMYFGVFDFSAFQASGCQFAPGVHCEDFYVGNDLGNGQEVIAQVRNTFGADLNIVSITAADSRATFGPCSDRDAGGTPFDWDRDTAFNLTCPFTGAYADGQAYDVTVRINFTQQGQTYEHSVIGWVTDSAQ